MVSCTAVDNFPQTVRRDAISSISIAPAKCPTCTWVARNKSATDVVQDLGVSIDCSLRFTAYINIFTAEAHNRARLIYKRFHAKEVRTSVTASTSYVRTWLNVRHLTGNCITLAKFKKRGSLTCFCQVNRQYMLCCCIVH
jgi:hypothetical protein